MEACWMADRAALRCLARQHPDWTQQELAVCIGRSRSFVKKWLKRLREAPPDDLAVLHSRSCARKTPSPSIHPRIIQRIVEMRESPPEQLQRVPGPKALLYYLPRDLELQALGAPLPRSTRTVWKILREQGCILDEPNRHHEPLEPRQPLEEVQMDFKDASSVPADPEGKQRHVVEVLNFVDAGTSILLNAQVHQDFHAETAFEAVVLFLRQYGLPPMLTFDRDPRWVGSSSGRDFPSALRRFLLCLGIEPNVCPPQRPDKNPYVERYHRALNQECLQIHRPGTLEQVREVTAQFMQHYNTQRPHQGRSCGNRPPQVAHPTLPVLPPLPKEVDPDHWLTTIDGQAFARKVDAHGCVTVDLESYYLKQTLAGQRVVLFVNAQNRAFDVYLGSQLIKQVPIKGLRGETMPFERYVDLMREEARSEARHLLQKKGSALRQQNLWG